MHAQAFRACLVRIFIGLSLGSVGPEDWLVILRPGVGVFDLKKQAVFEWLDLPCLKDIGHPYFTGLTPFENMTVQLFEDTR